MKVPAETEIVIKQNKLQLAEMEICRIEKERKEMQNWKKRSD